MFLIYHVLFIFDDYSYTFSYIIFVNIVDVEVFRRLLVVPAPASIHAQLIPAAENNSK